ncbi:acyltransferase [Paramixta manurensis]|uniref:Acyltransferase n=1 Tax=Paramixta manurensis TaxID=2740817 RepID=A0A6M8UB99_9GAMM|nr:acyltransferase [Erwiniaceae bacterium PD-1]
MRIQSIDYLRGVMALSVVFYHVAFIFGRWGVMDSGTILGRFGIYAVSAFYVISGMALYLAHKNSKWDLSAYGFFMLKRFLRLAPVYWVALCLLTYLTYKFSILTIDPWSYLQNIFLTFGVTSPTGYIVMGGWSIGNEIVFYLFFPFFILMARNRYMLLILSLFSAALFLYCATMHLDSDKPFGWQWSQYINPLNQVYFFIFGIISARILLPYVGRRKALCSCFALLLLFLFVARDVGGDLINIITGTEKVFFTTITLMLCSSFFLMGDLREIKPIHYILKFLGDISYPIYLLHGTTFIFVKKLFVTNSTPNSTVIIYAASTIALLMLASWLCHIAIERPMLKLSKHLPNIKIPVIKTGAAHHH